MADILEALPTPDGLLDLLKPYAADSPTLTWILAQFPANPVRQFQQLYCAWLAVQLARNLPAHVRFLSWFDSSGLQLARKRGLGAHPSKLYGLITPPRLSGPQLRLVGLALIGCLLAACAPVLPRVFLFLAYILSLCYFPNLYAEVTCSGHSTILIPSLLFILSCSSSLDHQVPAARPPPLACASSRLSPLASRSHALSTRALRRAAPRVTGERRAAWPARRSSRAPSGRWC